MCRPSPASSNTRQSGAPDGRVSQSVVCVLRSTDSASDAKRASQPAFESYQLAEFIYADQTLEVIFDAIYTAWSIDPKHDPASLRLKFHPGTKLLFVSGPAPATTITRQVVAGLRKNPVPR